MTEIRSNERFDPLWMSIYEYGWPFCHEQCARSYWLVVYDLGEDHETSLKIGVN